ncbi:MAG: hypothetical protein COB30_010105 [Ectothiorhodospiraceae bacterium]|nr:hypothetical protein [Ectothiorhodospiraceae bacterium]
MMGRDQADMTQTDNKAAAGHKKARHFVCKNKKCKQTAKPYCAQRLRQESVSNTPNPASLRGASASLRDESGGSRGVQWLRSQANNGAASRAGVTGLAALAALPSSQAINPRLACGAASPSPPPPTNTPAQVSQAVPNITLWALTNPVPGLGGALAVAPVSSGRRSKSKAKACLCATRTGLTARAKAKSSPWCRE